MPVFNSNCRGARAELSRAPSRRNSHEALLMSGSVATENKQNSDSLKMKKKKKKMVPYLSKVGTKFSSIAGKVCR